MSYMESSAAIDVTLPPWVAAFKDAPECVDDAGWMRLAIALCDRQIDEGTGGPFAAVVVEEKQGLISVGLNRVVDQCCSSAHAEVVALSLAQKRLGTHDLASRGLRCSLYSTSEPCAMCIGAIHWSGVARVLCAARDEDVRAIGFDEGNKPDDWVASLQHSGTQVIRDLLRDEASAQLLRYADGGGTIYNASGTSE